MFSAKGIDDPVSLSLADLSSVSLSVGSRLLSFRELCYLYSFLSIGVRQTHVMLPINFTKVCVISNQINVTDAHSLRA